MMGTTTDQLLTVLREQAHAPALDYATEPRPLTGGFWAELFTIRLTGAPEGWPDELVARVMPNPATAAKETVIQREVGRLGFPTPAVRAASGPGPTLGRAFIVMDRAEGSPLLDGLNGIRTLTRLPRFARTLPDVLARTMARLHAVDPTSVRTQLCACPVATTVEQLVRSLNAAALAADRADLAVAAGWLAAHQPPPAPEVVCHGDLHPFNVLVDLDGHATVIDWSASLLGAAAYDVAFTSVVLSAPPMSSPRALQPVVTGLGRALARRFRRRYERYSGTIVDTGSLRWHEGVVRLRALVEVATWDETQRAARAGHPWLVCGDDFAAQLAKLIGQPVAAR